MDTVHATWRKASFSGLEDNCVEVAALPERRVAVRNSNRSDGAVVYFTRPEMAAWIKGMQAGEFDDLA